MSETLNTHVRPSPTAGKLVAIVRYGLLACILLGYLAIGLQAVRKNTNSSAFDQRSFLGLGIKMAQGDKLSDGNRHPLYPVLLTPFSQRDWSYFTSGKLVSLTLGLATLLLVFHLVRRSRDDAVALGTTLLLSLNAIFLRVTSHVMSESLLLPLAFLAWYLGVRCLQGIDDDESPSRPRVWLAAGAVTGLVYLSKGTGQIFLFVFLLAALWRYRRALRRTWPYVMRYLGAYALVAAPLWIYNAIRYGNPLYNHNTTHTMWFDAWEDKYASGPLPTLGSYLRTHSPGQMVNRQWRGLGDVFPSWVEALSPGGSAIGLWILIALALGAVLLAALLDRRTLRAYLGRHTPELVYSGLLAVVLYLLFAWYVQVYEAPRFFLPLAPLAYLYASDAILWLVRRGGRASAPDDARPSRRRRIAGPIAYAVVALGAIAALVGRAGALRELTRDPYAVDREHNAPSEELFAWIGDNLVDDPADDDLDLLWGPSTTFGSWRYEGDYDFGELPSDAETWDHLLAYMQEEECDYALIDVHTLQRRGGLLNPYFAQEGDRVALVAPPPDWALTYLQPGLPCRWCLFQFMERVPIQHPLYLSLGHSIRLVGYDLQRTRLAPGEHLRFTLYWRALDPVEADYTVFSHLLGTGNVMLAQQDRQPLQGRLPTSQWQPGALYADRFDLALPENTPAGTAQLQVGLYDLATMERLPVTDCQGQCLTDDRVLLAEVTIVER